MVGDKHSYAPDVEAKSKAPEFLAATYGLSLAILAIFVSNPETGELLFRGYFVQDADEIIRSWYGRCVYKNPLIIPYSHLSMPGWTSVLAVGEWLGRNFGLPLTLPGRLVTVTCAWLCLHQGIAFIRRLGGSTWLAVAYVIVLGASPAFFLMALTVYPSVALAALVISAIRYRGEDRHTLAAGLIALTPLIRWEGVLLIALFLLFTLYERRWKSLPALLLPYGLYLVVNAVQFGNPWKPLAYRTTRAMGAWLPFNKYLTWEQFEPGLVNLMTLYSPGVLVGLLPLAALVTLKRRRHLVLLALAFAGLSVALLSIQHEFIVYALRVFLTPYSLGVLLLVSFLTTVSSRARITGISFVSVAVAVSLLMSFIKINNATIPASGGYRSEAGFHLVVRYADAAPVLHWLLEQEKPDYILTNHMNANLLRADKQCQLYDLPLHLGSPEINLDRGFKPLFERPSGRGLLVFGTLPIGVDDCTLRFSHKESRITVYECDTPK